MAQLKDLIVTGNTRAIGPTYLSETYFLKPIRPCSGQCIILDNEAYISSTINESLLRINSTGDTEMAAYGRPTVIRSSGDNLYHLRNDKNARYNILDSSNHTNYTVVVLTGTAEPTASQGKNGDIYIQTN